MKYKLYSKTKKFLDAVWQDIKNAKTSIYIEMYIFSDANGKYDFTELLIKKANEWVEILLIVDAIGSRELKKESIAKMKKAWIDFNFFSDRLRRTHRKIIIIDKEIGYFGWSNMKASVLHWLDLQIRIRGKRIIRPLTRTFVRTYKMCGGKNEKILKQYKKGILKKIKTFFIESFPGHKMYSLTDYYKEKIITAKKYIKITTPYFIPPRWLIALLDDAKKRGVIVEIIIPQDTDIKILNKINYHYINELLDLGIHFYVINKMNHAKVMIVDDEEVIIWSQNIDRLSFNHNYEAGGIFKQKKIVHNLVTLFDDRKRQSQWYKKTNIRLSIWDKIIGQCLKLFFYFI